MDFINLIVGFLMGILSSYVFWLTLALTKPKIAISPFVVFNPKDSSLLVKIINMGQRQAVDIRINLAVNEVTLSGLRRTIHKPELKTDYRFALEPKHKDMDNKWGLPTSTSFVMYDGQRILDMMEPSNGIERRLVFTLSATDAISGAKIVQRTSYSYTDIRYGEFSNGLIFEVLENR